MPIYEYRCSQCGHEFELEQRITEPPTRRCVKCGRHSAVRTISATTFRLKGAGWYADGYSRTSIRSSSAKGGD